MSLTVRLNRAMARLGFELHFFTLTQDRQRVLLFLESRDAGVVIEGATMADCVTELEREAEAVGASPKGRRGRPERAAARRARRSLTVITGGARAEAGREPPEQI